MFPLILVLFLVVPIVELYVIVQVAGGIGVLETLGLLIVVSIVGAWLVKAQGIGLIRRVQAKLAAGELPGKELVDGAPSPVLEGVAKDEAEKAKEAIEAAGGSVELK